MKELARAYLKVRPFSSFRLQLESPISERLRWDRGAGSNVEGNDVFPYRETAVLEFATAQEPLRRFRHSLSRPT